MTYRPFFAHLIIPHPDTPRLLLIDGALPRLDMAIRQSNLTGPVNDAVRESLGLRATVLRPLREVRDDQKDVTHALYDLGPHDPDWQPPSGSNWAGRDALSEIALPDALFRDLLETWFGEQESGMIPASRKPWQRAGWFDEASRWIEQQAQAAGIRLSGPVQQPRSWGISNLLRAPAEGGDLWLKALPDFFRAEARFTQQIGEHYPENIPPVLAIDSERRWMLTKHFEGTLLPSTPHTGLHPADTALRQYAEIQIAQAQRVDDWLRDGIPDRRGPILAAQIDGIIVDEETLRAGGEHGLSDDAIRRLRALRPRLHEMIAALEAAPIPNTLVHGDLHGENIAVDGERIVYFDWSDIAIGHPFFDLAIFFHQGDEIPELDGPDTHERLHAAYLEPWTIYAPLDALHDLYETVARPLAYAYVSVAYQTIRLHAEPSTRWELDGGAAFWLRKLIACFPHNDS